MDRGLITVDAGFARAKLDAEYSHQDHPSDGVLEEYSLNKSAESDLAALEEHLLICDQCRVKLDSIEPINNIHYTEDGPINSRATRLRIGIVMARHWGQVLDGGMAFKSIAAAKKYLTESFFQMFPEHRCNRLCGGTGIIASRIPAKQGQNLGFGEARLKQRIFRSVLARASLGITGDNRP